MTHLATFGAHKDLPRGLVRLAVGDLLESAKEMAREEIGSPDGSLVEMRQRYILYRTKLNEDGEPYPVPEDDDTFTGYRVKVLVDFIMEGDAPANAPTAPVES